MDDRVGKQVGNYQLVRLLGRGAFAEIYLGEHIYLGTRAAIKLLSGWLIPAGEVARFQREARTVAALAHPHIVRVLEFGVEGEVPYLVMDYAPGGSLLQRHPPGTPVPLATVVPYVQQIARGLQYAHNHQVIHRDIKPQNLLLGREDEVLLSDFGISVVAENASHQLTHEFAGTAAYAAPEQAQGHPLPASDQYSLGMIVYEWLTGAVPFTGPFLEVMWKHANVPPPPLREKAPTIPPAVEQAVLIALSKDPKERFGSVQALANALGQASQPDQSAQPAGSSTTLPPAPAALPSITNPLLPALVPASSPPDMPTLPEGSGITPASIATMAPVVPRSEGPKVGPSRFGVSVKLFMALLLVAVLGGGTIGIIFANAHPGTKTQVQPTATPSPTATATTSPTPDPFAPYIASFPGPGCDKGHGNWAVADSRSGVVSCTATGMRLTQPPGARGLAEVYFYGPLSGVEVADNESIGIDIRNLTAHACVGIRTRNQGEEPGGYGLFVCRNGSWQISRYDNTTGNAKMVSAGTMTASSSYHLQVISNNTSQSIAINGSKTHTIHDSTYKSSSFIALVLYSGASGSDSAVFSNFIYTPIQ